MYDPDVPEHYMQMCLALDRQLCRLDGRPDYRPESARRATVISRLRADPSSYERMHSALTGGVRHLEPHKVAARRQGEMEAAEQARRHRAERFDRWASGSGRPGGVDGLLDYEQQQTPGLSERDAYYRVKNNVRDDAKHYERVFDRLEAEREQDEDADLAPVRSRLERPAPPRDRDDRGGHWGGV
jgi:hypothetical protein